MTSAVLEGDYFEISSRKHLKKNLTIADPSCVSNFNALLDKTNIIYAKKYGDRVNFKYDDCLNGLL